MGSQIDKQLYGAACYFLSRREHGFNELKKKLSSKYPEKQQSEIIKVLEFLRDKNFQSDIRYAEMLINSRFKKGYGINYIKGFVINKNVSNIDYLEALESLERDIDFNNSCFEYAKKFRRFDRTKLKRKLVARGFDFSQVNRALNLLDKEDKDMLY